MDAACARRVSPGHSVCEENNGSESTESTVPSWE